MVPLLRKSGAETANADMLGTFRLLEATDS
jgi:hypothetical protein